MSNRIKVVHLINDLGLGGAERFLADFATQLEGRHFEQQVLCLYGTGAFARPIEAAYIPVHVLGVGRHIRPKGWLQVYQALRPLKADVVHTHLTEPGWYGLPAAWLAGVPVRVAHLQNCYHHFPLKLRLLDMATSLFSDAAIACSGAVRDFYHTEFRYPARKLHVVYNSVDLSRFERLPERAIARCTLNLSPDALVLITIASLTEQKGHRYLLEAMDQVLQHFPQSVLLLVGDGYLRKSLEQFSQQHSLGAAVHFLGKRTDVPLILAAADVFVLSSLWEGMGLVLVEAGAVGLPAVATQVDGIPEVVEDGATGILVPPRQPELLAGAIVALLKDEGRRRQMGERARQRVSSMFSIQYAVAAIKEIYLSLLQRKSREI